MLAHDAGKINTNSTLDGVIDLGEHDGQCAGDGADACSIDISFIPFVAILSRLSFVSCPAILSHYFSSFTIPDVFP